MNQKVIDQMNLFAQSNSKFWHRFSDISADLTRRLTEVQFNMASLGLEFNNEQIKLLTNTANHKDLLSRESELASKYGSKVVELARETVDAMSEARDEVLGWLEDAAEQASATGVAANRSETETSRKSNKAA